MGQRGSIQLATSVRGQRAARERKLKPPDPERIVNRPELPGFLPKGAAEIWNHLVPELIAAGVSLRRCDEDALSAYCQTIHSANEISVELQRGQKDIKVKLQLIAARRGLLRDAVAYGANLGTTPQARMRMGIVNEAASEPDDEWDDL